MNPKFRQLTFAREYRGLTQTELASRIPGLSQSNLSKFEKGLQTLSDELLTRILNHLNFPLSFLEIAISNGEESSHYRKKATIPMKERARISRENKLIGYIIDCMSDEISYPEYRLPAIDIEYGYTPQAVASHVRKLFHLGDYPIFEPMRLIESMGVIIAEAPAQYQDFDGVSIITDKGNRVIIINKYMSNDRKRFTLAHELGHIIMHHGFLIPDYRDIEKEANEFASEFLMPSEVIRPSLRNLRFPSLPILKQYWLCSMAAIIKRAKDLAAITPEKAQYLMIELSRRGYRKNEPVEIPIDRPVLMMQAFRMFTTTLGYTPQQMAQTFHLPTDVIDYFFKDPDKMRFRIKAV